MIGNPQSRPTDGAEAQAGQAGDRSPEGRLRWWVARQGRRLRRLERLLLEHAATLDLHSEALLLLIREQLGSAEDLGSGPGGVGEPLPGWFDPGATPSLSVTRVG
jgi:hypothetical protein